MLLRSDCALLASFELSLGTSSADRCIVYTSLADTKRASLISLPSLPQLSPSYKPRDERKWLSEVLSHQFPAARILSYQYDFAKPKSEVCWTRILDEGEYLLYELIHRRKEGDEVDRPLSKTQRRPT